MAHSGVIIHYDLSELPDLTPQQELTFYRALQEGLTNGLKHGNSTVFELKMGRDGNQVTFDLKDNGNIQDWFWTFSNGSTGSHDWWNSYCRTRKDGKGAHLHICCPLVPGNAERAGKEFSL